MSAPFLLVYSDGEGRLGRGVLDSGVWAFERVDPRIIGSVDVLSRADGGIAVLVTEESTCELFFANQPSGRLWSTMQLTRQNSGTCASFPMDSDSIVRVAYKDVDDRQAVYLRFRDSGGDMETHIIDAGSASNSLNLALDSNERPWISCRVSIDRLRVAHLALISE